MSWVYDSWEWGTLYEETWVRMCPPMLDVNYNSMDDRIAFGLVIYHELNHMISATTDAQGGYNKLGAHTLAQTVPEVARLSADNYTMYVAQAGMNLE